MGKPPFPMGFLWVSYGFPMVFLCFSYGFPMVNIIPKAKNPVKQTPLAFTKSWTAFLRWAGEVGTQKRGHQRRKQQRALRYRFYDVLRIFISEIMDQDS